MAERPTLQEILKDFDPEKLDLPCRDDHLSKLALSITDWQSIAPLLKLTEADEEELKRDYPNTITQKIAMLGKWKRNAGRRAKYRKLISVLWVLKQVDLIEKVCELLKTESSSSDEDGISTIKETRGRETEQSANNEAIESLEDTITMDGTSTQPKQTESDTQILTLDSYAEYLKLRYSAESSAFFTLQHGKEFVHLTLRGDVDGRRESPIELKNLFELDEKARKVILIEGTSGTGKSTLAWHICQKWGSGELFKKFKVVVFAQLRDPAIQSARSLADILPARSGNMCTQLQSIMKACDGDGVLFVLDGWDEYGPGVQPGSLFQQLICSPGNVNMHFSSLIITSRPIASDELQRYTSFRVEIVGFTTAEVKKYFSESIDDSETVQKLQNQLRERPGIEASCYLPLNAAIVAHLFPALNHLPHTLHEVFLSFILYCIKRYLTRQAGEGREIPDVSSLADLPPEVQETFNSICSMAFHGVMENKATFSAMDLQTYNLSTELNTLGLIQGVQSFIAFKASISFNFLHRSVQEHLAAFHTSKLSAAEQIKIFNNLIDQPRLAAVLQFYVAFTKLQTEGVRDIVTRIVQKQEKPLLINLLHGLHEAQDLSLCQFVASHLNGELNLQGSIPNSIDCFVVGYFLSCVCLTTSGEFKVNLSNCSLDDYRASFLVKELSKCFSSTDAQTLRGNGSLIIELSENRIQEEGGKAISDVLMNRSLRVLDLHGNPISAGVVHIADCLGQNSCLKKLDISDCGVGNQGMKSLASALETNSSLEELCVSRNHAVTSVGLMALRESLQENKSLQVLDLHGNPISAGVVHIAEFLKCNYSLVEINLGDCRLTEKEAESLAISLKDNNSLQTLILRKNNLSDHGAARVADCLRHNSCLKKLDISDCGVGDQGMESLASALETNSSLEDLCVSQNHAVTRVGLLALGKSLQKNKRLKTLELIENDNISEDDLKQFVSFLQENSHLTKLFSTELYPEMHVLESVNRIRQQKDLPRLEVLKLSREEILLQSYLHQFKEAMKEGHIDAQIVKCLFIGSAGSGKTNTIYLLFGWDPPSERHSTGCIDPFRAISCIKISNDGEVWEKVNSETLRSLLASGVHFTFKDLCEHSGEATSGGTSETTSKDTNDTTSKDTNDTTSKDTNDTTSGSTSEANSGDTRRGTSEGTGGDASEGAGGDTSEATRGGISEANVGGASEATSGGTSEATSGGISEATSGGTSEATSGGTSEVTSGGTSEATSGGTSEATSGDTSEANSGTLGKASRETSTNPSETEVTIASRLSKGMSQSLKIRSTKWIYLIDSGGQSHFHQVLSAFLKDTSAGVFVIDLSKELSDHPLMEFYSSGKQDGRPCECPLTHEEIFRSCIQTIQSLQYTAEESKCPKIFVVGTHLDKVKPETIEINNEQLKKILFPTNNSNKSSFHDNVFYTDSSRTKVIFAVNATSREKPDTDIAQELQNKIASISPPVHQIPLCWYGLELEVESFAAANKTMIVTLGECVQMGKKLHFPSDESVEAALVHLHKLNIFLYYPDILPNLVFTNPCVLLDKVRELVQKSYQLKGHSGAERKGSHFCDKVRELVPKFFKLRGRSGVDRSHEATEGKWSHFCDRGIITPDILEGFPSNKRDCDYLSSKQIVKLFKHLLIVAPINETEFFMPALLDFLKPEDIVRHSAEHAKGPSSEYAGAYVISFPNGYAPCGLFSALVAFLCSSWELGPGKLYGNCITFSVKTSPVSVTLLDFGSYFEVHVTIRSELQSFCSSLYKSTCPEVRSIIAKGIEKVITTRNFRNIEYNEAILCRCKKSSTPHPATIQIKKPPCWWSCTLEVVCGKLQSKDLVWFHEVPRVEPSTAPQETKQTDQQTEDVTSSPDSKLDEAHQGPRGFRRFGSISTLGAFIAVVLAILLALLWGIVNVPHTLQKTWSISHAAENSGMSTPLPMNCTPIPEPQR